MFEDVNKRRSRWRTFWPEVDDLEGAEEAIRLCCWFAFAGAGLTGAIGLMGFLFGNGDPSGLAAATILAAIGVGVRRRWRSAAVAGLLLLVPGPVAALAGGRPPGVIDTLTLIAFMSGVRGTFAYVRLNRAAAKSSVAAV